MTSFRTLIANHAGLAEELPLIHTSRCKVPSEPPTVLYHGTAPHTAQIILTAGLKPMGRQYVHLSADRGTASQVGHRKARQPVILQAAAAEAHAAGVVFYKGNEQIWLADYVPATFIR